MSDDEAMIPADSWDDCWAEDSLVSNLLKRGWTPEEAEAARANLAPTFYKDGNGGEYEYTDNLRLARLANPDEMALFAQISKQGCCGFYDEELLVVLPDGRESRVIVGFNYGH